MPQEFIKIVEVGPRDGLQNEATPVTTDTKVELIRRLAAAGFQHIEATAFVSPQWVPQMADASAVRAQLERKNTIQYSALVPNLKGYEAALAAKVDEVVIFGAASEAFSQKNINCSIAESLERFRPVAQAAQRDGLRLRGSVSCAFVCPYSGEVSTSALVQIAQGLQDLGCAEIDICDTIGAATAKQVRVAYEALAKVIPVEKMSGHFHDTYGQALANILAALDSGIRIFHASVAGLGGCPYAKGATGNVATEDVLYLLQGLGYETGIDFAKACEAGHFIAQSIGRPNHSRAANAWLAKCAA